MLLGLGHRTEQNAMKRCSVVEAGSLFQLAMMMLISAQSSPLMSVPKRIDTHCHYVPPFYRNFLNARNITSGGRPIPDWNASAHLAVNDLAGIATSVISISTPGAKLSPDAPVEEGRLLARQLNDYGNELTVQYSKRFLFFASLTLPDVEGAVAEAIYALDKLNAAGIVLEASTFGELLGTPRYAPLYKVLNDRHTITFIHPSNSPYPDGREDLEAAASTVLPPFVIDFLLDTTRAAVNLVYRNVTRDYPNIKFILAHSGGFLPFAATRAAGGLAILSGQPSLQSYYLEELSKFNVDLALSATPTALPSTTAFINTTCITFGSDFPYAPLVVIEQNTAGLQTSPLGEGAKKRINYENAYALFKKFLK